MKIDGAKMKKAREIAGLSVTEVAVIAGYTENNIRYIESGKVKTMNDHILKVVAKALHVKPEELRHDENV